MPDHGKGSWLWDDQGRAYLDFAAGIAVSALGHAHPELIRALTEQAERYWHVSNVLTNPRAIRLARMLCEATFADRVFLANSGSEANEAALKLARRHAVNNTGEHRHEIVAFEGAFHGRTLFTVSVGGQPAYSSGFGPKPGGISHLPFNDVAALENYFADQGESVCAVILEPCLGESGVVPATPAFLQAVRKQCDEYGALMVLDEVQTGVGRSGNLYAYQKMGVVPDILTTAKGLGGGFPVSAMLTTENIASNLVVGTHGSTFGGNPMACAVACRVLELVDTAEMREGVAARTGRIMAGLAAINDSTSIFSDIRGCGMLIGCELDKSFSGKARDLLTACTENGLLALVAGPDVLRLAPALNIPEGDIDQGLERLGAAVRQFLENQAS